MSDRVVFILGSSSQQPTRFRNHGGYFIRWNNEGFLFDPGEGTQRQFIFANVAPTAITRIFVSHFHGDHCLGLPSIFMRLNLDKIKHPVHCYYPASGQVYFDRLKSCTIYHQNVKIIEHPVDKPGFVSDDGSFKIEAAFLDHSIETLGWRVTESDTRKFDSAKLKEKGIVGPLVKKLEKKGKLKIGNETVSLDEVSWIRPGDSIALVIDTRFCQNAIDIAKDAKILICESTYQEDRLHLAKKHYHLTAKQAALIAKQAGVEKLILTHFSARYPNGKGFLKEARDVFPNTFVGDDLKTFPFPKNEPK